MFLEDSSRSQKSEALHEKLFLVNAKSAADKVKAGIIDEINWSNDQ